MAFLTLTRDATTLTVPVRRDGASEEPDGFGRRRWTFELPPLPEATYAALRTLLGTPTGAEADRAWDGTLHTDLPFVTAGGEFASVVGVTDVEGRMTTARFRHTSSTAVDECWKRVMTLVLREA